MTFTLSDMLALEAYELIHTSNLTVRVSERALLEYFPDDVGALALCSQQFSESSKYIDTNIPKVSACYFSPEGDASPLISLQMLLVYFSPHQY